MQEQSPVSFPSKYIVVKVNNYTEVTFNPQVLQELYNERNFLQEQLVEKVKQAKFQEEELNAIQLRCKNVENKYNTVLVECAVKETKIATLNAHFDHEIKCSMFHLATSERLQKEVNALKEVLHEKQKLLAAATADFEDLKNMI